VQDATFCAYTPSFLETDDYTSGDIKDVEINYSWTFVGKTNPEMAMGILLLVRDAKSDLVFIDSDIFSFQISFLIGGTGVGVAFTSEIMKGTKYEHNLVAISRCVLILTVFLHFFSIIKERKEEERYRGTVPDDYFDDAKNK
jgi:hypothetical protein